MRQIYYETAEGKGVLCDKRRNYVRKQKEGKRCTMRHRRKELYYGIEKERVVL